MREKVVKTAENLNNLLTSEVSAMETVHDEVKSLYGDYIVVMHHKMADEYESREELFSVIEDEMTMVWAYLNKNPVFGLIDIDELILKTSIIEYGSGMVGFTIKIGEYYH